MTGWGESIRKFADHVRLWVVVCSVCTVALSCAPLPISLAPTVTPAETTATPQPAILVATAAPPPVTEAVVGTTTPITAANSPAEVPVAPISTEISTPALPNTPGPTPTPEVWPTVTRQLLPAATAAGLEPCARRVVDDTDLALVVTQQFGLPETYAPADLVPLSDYFTSGVTVGIDSYVRIGLIEPLQRIIDDMYAAGLGPSILSGYRSYGEQYLAWKWWNSQYPERVAIMSARAGHSEHQLGTTVDFGSPALDHLFHVDFATTPEGLWLADNAHRYGFTMSYPADTYDITGFKYEPWHYRYVGVDLSTELRATGRILTEWQLDNLPPPCIP